METGKIFTDNSFWTPKEWAGGTVETVLHQTKHGTRLDSHTVERPALRNSPMTLG